MKAEFDLASSSGETKISPELWIDPGMGQNGLFAFLLFVAVVLRLGLVLRKNKSEYQKFSAVEQSQISKGPAEQETGCRAKISVIKAWVMVILHCYSRFSCWQYMFATPIVSGLFYLADLVCISFPLIIIGCQLKSYKKLYPDHSFSIWTLYTNYEHIKDTKHNQ